MEQVLRCSPCVEGSSVWLVIDPLLHLAEVQLVIIMAQGALKRLLACMQMVVCLIHTLLSVVLRSACDPGCNKP